jgi:hypothetical protein
LPEVNIAISDCVVMKVPVDIPRPTSITPNKCLVPWRSFILRVAGKHALQADAYTFDIVNRRPCSFVKEVETYYAVGVDVRVYWNGMGVVFDEYDLGRL